MSGIICINHLKFSNGAGYICTILNFYDQTVKFYFASVISSAVRRRSHSTAMAGADSLCIFYTIGSPYSSLNPGFSCPFCATMNPPSTKMHDSCLSLSRGVSNKTGILVIPVLSHFFLGEEIDPERHNAFTLSPEKD